MKYPNGDVFAGMFVAGKREGEGTYTFANGGEYKGAYADWLKSGAGVFTYPDGGKYEGAFAEDKKSGEGVYTYPNGDMYSGLWAEDKKAGQGSYLFKASMSTFMGEWEAGEFKSGEWILKDGCTFKGTFAEGKPVEGTWTFAKTGNSLTGSYGEDGKFVGGEIKAC